ncbi:MAG: bifunctional serine/threonine-protein kinase/formylglycine-generating enzyme family protein [Marinicellaceae bacterium]
MLKTINNLDIKISGLNILSKIGEGGMSKVYLAEQISLKRKVAVKVMRLEISENDLDVQRFKHEAKTIARLDHPNIIDIYNIGQTSKGEVFYTMPYLNHGDFSNYIIENEQEFIQLLKTICDGLLFAHNQGVVHRDIKPENLLFDEFGNVRIADFGIAITKNGTRMTKEHQIVGSAQYMSPEQARSLKVDVHTDIYSLGIVIYERLTGQVPFDSDESISILVNHVSAKPPKLPPKMRHWQKLIDNCLAKKPSNRYDSMLALKNALDKIPITSIQRTNNTIGYILDSSYGKHLKWIVPAVFVIVLIIAGMSKFTQENDSIDSIASNDNTNSNTLVKDITPPSKNNQTKKIEGDNTLVSDSMPIDSELSIDEIKQKIAFQNSTIGESPVVLTEEEIQQIALQEQIIKANENIEKFQLSRPKNNNATDQLLAVLEQSPNNIEAISGLELIGTKYFQLISNAIKKNHFPTALKHSKSVIQFNNKTDNINSQFTQQKTSILNSLAGLDENAEEFTADKIKNIKKIVKIYDEDHDLIEKLDGILKLKAGPQVGDKLLDEMGIETILVKNNLAVTTHEITVEDYTEFILSTDRDSAKCKHEAGGFNTFFSNYSWNKPLFNQTSRHPVVCISHSDALAYSKWLSEQTENRYRLPTKDEWLELAQEDNNNFSPCKTANVAGVESKKSRVRNQKYDCSDSFEFTAPVASFKINTIGLFDIQGNVSEWVGCDENNCSTPVALGSSWFDGKKSNQLNLSNQYNAINGYTHIGFRLVRDL